MLIYLIINIICYYLIPLAIKDTGSGIFILLFIIPIVLAITSSIYGYKTKKIDLTYNILTSIIFIPVVFIYMNSSALIYVFIYFIITTGFNYIGSKINNKRNSN